jgi:hypothetical protein
LLKLNSGEIGIVVNCQENGQPGRPNIVLLIRDDNGKFKKGNSVDLPAVSEFMSQKLE